MVVSLDFGGGSFAPLSPLAGRGPGGEGQARVVRQGYAADPRPLSPQAGRGEEACDCPSPRRARHSLIWAVALVSIKSRSDTQFDLLPTRAVMPQHDAWGNKTVAALGLALLAVLPVAALAAAQQAKSPSWSHAFDHKCRDAKHPIFKDAPAFGIEVFRDENNGNGIYID